MSSRGGDATAAAIIFLHGPSSSGKSTIARELQAIIERPFWHFSIDHLRDAGVLPLSRSVEHIVETRGWLELLVRLLAPFDVFFAAVRCPLDELERREAARGDRPRGDARRDLASIHLDATFDLDLDGRWPAAANVRG